MSVQHISEILPGALKALKPIPSHRLLSTEQVTRQMTPGEYREHMVEMEQRADGWERDNPTWLSPFLRIDRRKFIEREMVKKGRPVVPVVAIRPDGEREHYESICSASLAMGLANHSSVIAALDKPLRSCCRRRWYRARTLGRLDQATDAKVEYVAAHKLHGQRRPGCPVRRTALDGSVKEYPSIVLACLGEGYCLPGGRLDAYPIYRSLASGRSTRRGDRWERIKAADVPSQRGEESMEHRAIGSACCPKKTRPEPLSAL